MDRLDRRTALQGIAATTALLGAGVAPRARAATIPAPKISLGRVLERANSAKNKRTTYLLTVDPPSERLGAWPENRKADCSGFVGWCFGLPRKPAQLVDLKLGTDQVYADATGANKLFAKIDAPQVGDVVLYPNYRIAPGAKGSSGHIALITAVAAGGRYETIECASTPFDKTGDAIAFDRGDSVFLSHPLVLEQIRKHHPDLPPAETRGPIFARYVGLVR